MEETKKLDEASKSEEIVEPVERVELTDDQLDQASGGMKVCTAFDARDIAVGKAGIASDKAQVVEFACGAIIWKPIAKDH